MKKYWATGNYGNELQLTQEQAMRGSHSGSCDDDVAAMMPDLKKQLDKIDPEALRKELKEYGAWSEKELSDHQENLARWVWLCCGTVRDENNF